MFPFPKILTVAYNQMPAKLKASAVNVIMLELSMWLSRLEAPLFFSTASQSHQPAADS